MTEIAKFWGVLAVFCGAAFVVVSVMDGNGISVVALIIAWGVIAAGLALVMLAAMAVSLQRIADLQLSPDNRLVLGHTARTLMTRQSPAPRPDPERDDETDPPPHRRPVPMFRSGN